MDTSVSDLRFHTDSVRSQADYLCSVEISF